MKLSGKIIGFSFSFILIVWAFVESILNLSFMNKLNYLDDVAYEKLFSISVVLVVFVSIFIVLILTKAILSVFNSNKKTKLVNIVIDIILIILIVATVVCAFIVYIKNSLYCMNYEKSALSVMIRPSFYNVMLYSVVAMTIMLIVFNKTETVELVDKNKIVKEKKVKELKSPKKESQTKLLLNEIEELKKEIEIKKLKQEVDVLRKELSE